MKVRRVAVNKGYQSGPGACVSWGLQDGHGFDAAPNGIDDYVAFCKSKGVLWHSLQVIPDNDIVGPALRAACKAQRVHFGGWTNVPQEVGSDAQLESLLNRIQAYGCGFFQANIEYRGSGIGDGSRNGWHKAFATAFRKRFPKKPATVNTNFGGFDTPEGGYDELAAAIYINSHFECQHEDYWVNLMPNGRPIDGDYAAHNLLKWPRPSSSMAGIFSSETGKIDPSTGELWKGSVLGERQRLIESGRHHIEWVWTAEYLTEEDWNHMADVF